MPTCAVHAVDFWIDMLSCFTLKDSEQQGIGTKDSNQTGVPVSGGQRLTSAIKRKTGETNFHNHQVCCRECVVVPSDNKSLKASAILLANA